MSNNCKHPCPMMIATLEIATRLATSLTAVARYFAEPASEGAPSSIKEALKPINELDGWSETLYLISIASEEAVRVNSGKWNQTINEACSKCNITAQGSKNQN